MLQQVLTSSQDIYKESARIISTIEDKAQKAAGLAGIFLAAAFSFLRKDSLHDLAGLAQWSGLILLGLAIFFMLACVLTAAWTLWPRELQSPPDPSQILEKVDLRLNRGAQEPSDESRENNLREQARVWNLAVGVQARVIDDKSKLLVATHVLLMFGISCVFALLVLSIFVYGSAALAGQ